MLHHISTPLRRVAALQELVRIVRRGGRVLVTAWALEQDKFRDAGEQARAVLSRDAGRALNARLFAGLVRRLAFAGAARQGDDDECGHDDDDDKRERSDVGWWTTLSTILSSVQACGLTLSFFRLLTGVCRENRKGELEALCDGACLVGLWCRLVSRRAALWTELVGARIVTSYYDADNWCVVLQRTE